MFTVRYELAFKCNACLHWCHVNWLGIELGPGSIPAESMWGLWCIKLHCDRFPPSTYISHVIIIPPLLHADLYLHERFLYFL
jgi:hypothetical protein